MDNILEIRSLEGEVTKLVKDDFIRNHLPAIYDRTLNLKGAILDTVNYNHLFLVREFNAREI